MTSKLLIVVSEPVLSGSIVWHLDLLVTFLESVDEWVCAGKPPLGHIPQTSSSQYYERVYIISFLTNKCDFSRIESHQES